MEVSIKREATFQPRLQDQNVAPSLTDHYNLDIPMNVEISIFIKNSPSAQCTDLTHDTLREK